MVARFKRWLRWIFRGPTIEDELRATFDRLAHTLVRSEEINGLYAKLDALAGKVDTDYALQVVRALPIRMLQHEEHRDRVEAELKVLPSRLEELEQRVSDQIPRTEVDNLRSELAELRGSIDRNAGRLQDGITKLQRAGDYVGQLTLQNEELQRQVLEIPPKFQITTAALKQSEQAFLEARSDIGRAEHDLRKARENIGQLTEKVNGFERKITEVAAHFDQTIRQVLAPRFERYEQRLAAFQEEMEPVLEYLNRQRTDEDTDDVLLAKEDDPKIAHTRRRRQQRMHGRRI